MHRAYEWVVAAIMLAESNYVVQRLGLPEKVPISRERVKHVFVAPPEVMSFGGRLDADKYSFSFPNSERLCHIHKLDPFGGLSEFEAIQRMASARERSKVTSEEAYRIATNWLCSLEVDLRKLEAAAPPRTQQRIYWDKDRPQPVPIFDVIWGKPESPHVSVRLDGRTKEMIYIRQEVDYFSRRPAQLLKDRERLLAITDEEFVAYSAAEKDTLVSKFSAAEQLSTARPPTDPAGTSAPLAKP